VKRCCWLCEPSPFDLQSAIAGTSRALPVVFITGHGDEEVRTQALEAGAVDVLFKPIDEDALVTAIEKALGPSPREIP
jgi:two-component system response regulator FixJ